MNLKMAYLSDLTSTSIGNYYYYQGNNSIVRLKLRLRLILTLVLVLIYLRYILHKSTLDELVLVISKIKSGEYLPYAIDSFHTPLGLCRGMCLFIPMCMVI